VNCKLLTKLGEHVVHALPNTLAMPKATLGYGMKLALIRDHLVVGRHKLSSERRDAASLQ
jgi:hypothetical protein